MVLFYYKEHINTNKGKVNDMKARYSYFIEIVDGKHIGISAKEFKELSKHWEAQPEDENGITIYTIEGIECGRRCRKN